MKRGFFSELGRYHEGSLIDRYIKVNLFQVLDRLDRCDVTGERASTNATSRCDTESVVSLSNQRIDHIFVTQPTNLARTGSQYLDTFLSTPSFP